MIKHFALLFLVMIMCRSLETPIDDESDSAPNTTPIRFILLGDYGQLENPEGMNTTRDVMNRLAEVKKYDHIITAGDNIYMNGIENINNRSKADNVTKIFQGEHVKETPVHPTLGNHDWYSNANNEVLYSQYNPQWQMPSDYYVLETPLKDESGKVFVNLMLNVCKLFCPDDKYKVSTECRYMHQIPGSSVVKDHYDWLEEKLKYYSGNDTTAWLAVTMHYPPFTYSSLKETFLPLIQHYEVDFIFVGHEHWSEYSNMDRGYQTRFPEATAKIIKNCTHDNEILIIQDRVQNFEKGTKLHQILSGNGGQTFKPICPLLEQDGTVYFRNNGYYGVVAVEATSRNVTITYYRDLGDVVYTVNIHQ